MKGTRGAQGHRPGGWSGRTTLAKMKENENNKNDRMTNVLMITPPLNRDFPYGPTFPR